MAGRGTRPSSNNVFHTWVLLNYKDYNHYGMLGDTIAGQKIQGKTVINHAIWWQPIDFSDLHPICTVLSPAINKGFRTQYCPPIISKHKRSSAEE